MIKLPKKSINTAIILATLAAAVYYFNKHRDLLSELRHLPLVLFFLVFALNIVMFFTLVLMYTATLNLTKLRIGRREVTLINAYSMVINFFIPGQSGPAFRGYYLYKKHKLKVLDYSLATIIYYLFYGLVSVTMIFAGSKPWWITLGAALLMVLVSLVGLKLYLHKFKHDRLDLHLKPLLFLLLATGLQAIVQICIYYSELHYLNHNIKIGQVITYTGAANLALFVALTPGAIGVRESFLILSKRLHHISNANIVLANVIDRTIFILFLLILGLIIITLKVKEKLGVSKIDEKLEQS